MNVKLRERITFVLGNSKQPISLNEIADTMNFKGNGSTLMKELDNLVVTRNVKVLYKDIPSSTRMPVRLALYTI